MAQHMAQQNAEGSRDLSTLVDASAELQHLVQTIWRLRQPDGCPWDREQTHRSIGKNMIEEAYEALDGRYPGALLRHADEHSYGTEFLAYRMSIRTVGSLDEAVEHIARYSSRHSEAVVSENAGTIREFQQRVDAACVYANVSTAFTDGAQFGLGAEIGISTQKLHARGPMALRELTTYKYLIDGDGQTRA